MPLFDLALQNLLSPMVLFFALGLASALIHSDLYIPDEIAKLLVIYLLISIGFRGGAEMAHYGLDKTLLLAIASGLILSFGMPFIGYALLRGTTNLKAVDAASIAGHYGSISAVTFAALTGALGSLSIKMEGYMVAVAAAMEAPAIFAALIIARKSNKSRSKLEPIEPAKDEGNFLRHVAFNGSIVILVGAFIIGTITGQRGLIVIKPFFVDLFPGFLCLFLLEMGLVAGRGLREGRHYLTPPVIIFAIVMPLIGVVLAATLSSLIGLSVGGSAALITLAASASYIAVPAALRIALPQANASIPLTLSLGITFPFNLLVGIPIYIGLAQWIANFKAL
jgi:uncharacterized protein